MSIFRHFWKSTHWRLNKIWPFRILKYGLNQRIEVRHLVTCLWGIISITGQLLFCIVSYELHYWMPKTLFWSFACIWNKCFVDNTKHLSLKKSVCIYIYISYNNYTPHQLEFIFSKDGGVASPFFSACYLEIGLRWRATCARTGIKYALPHVASIWKPHRTLSR